MGRLFGLKGLSLDWTFTRLQWGTGSGMPLSVCKPLQWGWSILNPCNQDHRTATLQNWTWCLSDSENKSSNFAICLQLFPWLSSGPSFGTLDWEWSKLWYSWLRVAQALELVAAGQDFGTVKKWVAQVYPKNRKIRKPEDHLYNN